MRDPPDEKHRNLILNLVPARLHPWHEGNFRSTTLASFLRVAGIAIRQEIRRRPRYVVRRVVVRGVLRGRPVTCRSMNNFADRLPS